jgi:halocin C8-like bacteriocin domain-containing protein
MNNILKFKKSISLILTIVLCFIMAFPVFASSDNDFVGASKEQSKLAISIVKKSDAYKDAESNEGTQLNDQALVTLSKAHPNLAFINASKINGNNIKVRIFVVDVEKKVLLLTNAYDANKLSDDKVELKIKNSKNETKFELSKDGSITHDKKTYSIEEFKKAMTNQSNVSDEVSASISCSDAVGIICALASTYGGNSFCAAVTISTWGIGGIFCYGAYAVIAYWGCSAAVSMIC